MENNNTQREKEIIQQSKKWLKENPEKAQRINDAENLSFNDSPLPLNDINQSAILNKSVADFRKDYKKKIFKGVQENYIKEFNKHYFNLLKEIESKRYEIGFSDYLNNLKDQSIESEFKRLVFAFPKSKRILKFSKATMEALQNHINAELSCLEREKTKGDTKTGGGGKTAKNRVLAFNNIDDALCEIKLILEQMNEHIFENSTEKQWKQLLKGEKLTERIVLKKGITLSDIKYFLDEMERKGIWKANYTTMANIEAFGYKGKVLQAKQISHSTTQKIIDNEITKILPKHQKQIDMIISLLD